MKNATALYAFVTDDVANDNSGAIKVRVMDIASHATSTILVDAKSNSFAPEPNNRFTLRHLEPLSAYDIKLKDGRPGARTLGDKGGASRKLLLKMEPGWNAAVQPKKFIDDYQRILEVGKPIRLSGATSFWVTFPDDGLDDNSGTLELEVSAVAGSGGLLNRLMPRK